MSLWAFYHCVPFGKFQWIPIKCWVNIYFGPGTASRGLRFLILFMYLPAQSFKLQRARVSSVHIDNILQILSAPELLGSKIPFFTLTGQAGIEPDSPHVSVCDGDPGQHPGMLSSRNFSALTFDWWKSLTSSKSVLTLRNLSRQLPYISILWSFHKTVNLRTRFPKWLNVDGFAEIRKIIFKFQASTVKSINDKYFLSQFYILC